MSVVFLALSACVMWKTVGGFRIDGFVHDVLTNEPVEGVYIAVHYSAYGPTGDNSKTLSSTTTDTFGGFVIDQPKTKLVGGTGGLAGEISEWPSMRFSKRGYCSKHFHFVVEPSIDQYQNMQVLLSKKVDGKCT